MATWFDGSFKLVLQPDRRQIPDRRLAWRGGRRETDHIRFSAPRLCTEERTDWIEMDDERVEAEKTFM